MTCHRSPTRSLPTPRGGGRRRALAVGVTVVALLAVTALRPGAAGAATVIEAAYAAPGSWAVTHETIAGPGGTTAYEVFRPTNLGAGGVRHPIVTWGNGSNAVPAQYAGLLTHLASWGYVVIASTSTTTGTGTEILAGAQLLVTADTTPGSPYQGTLDTAHVAAVGHSQGAGGSVRATQHSGGLITTTVPINLPNRLWVSPGDEYEPSQLTDPVLFLTGGLDLLIAGPLTMNGFYAEVPGAAAKGAVRFAGHNEVQGDGGRFRGYITAWLRYQLSGDATARAAFVGSPPEMNGNSGWAWPAQKNLP
ncbi:MAG TPA: hypothetical protein VK507_10775 [Iamia sp.]|nr:hypothetical protein [Iamia sp.]